MDFLTALWLPIVASAVAVFIASSIIWMATPLHKHDYKNPGDAEGPIMDLVRRLGLKPGVYFVPWCHGKDMKDPAVQAKMKAGPWAQLIVMPGGPSMGKMLGSWFVHLVIVCVFVAWIVFTSGVTHMVAPATKAEFMPVFKMAAISSFLAYGGYSLPLAIWHGQPWSQVPSRVLDGVIYACVTGAIFGALAGVKLF